MADDGYTQLKKVVAGAIGMLSILPFMPDDLESVTKAWLWCVESEGYSPLEVKRAGQMMLKELDRFPVPSTLLAYCAKARESLNREDIEQRIIGYDADGNPWACLPSEVDGVRFFEEKPRSLPQRSVEENKAIIRKVMGDLPCTKTNQTNKK